MAGYHVHEKAVLMAALPLALAGARSAGAARAFLRASLAGHCGLLPLLFTADEYPIKARPP
jgi:alpha-1,3-glucosyltransferase